MWTIAVGLICGLVIGGVIYWAVWIGASGGDDNF